MIFPSPLFMRCYLLSTQRESPALTGSATSAHCFGSRYSNVTLDVHDSSQFGFLPGLYPRRRRTDREYNYLGLLRMFINSPFILIHFLAPSVLVYNPHCLPRAGAEEYSHFRSLSVRVLAASSFTPLRTTSRAVWNNECPSRFAPSRPASLSLSLTHTHTLSLIHSCSLSCRQSRD